MSTNKRNKRRLHSAQL